MPVKRKYSDRANWRRITEKSFQVKSVQTIGFTGYVSLFTMHNVTEPLWKEYNGKRFCVANRGYKWLQHFPERAHYIVTTMFNEQDDIVQWYIDICKTQGVTDSGVPWFDDLYLDIVILPTGEMFLLDEDELKDAVERHLIPQADYDFAWKVAKQVMEEYQNGSLDLLLVAKQQLSLWD